MSFWLTVRRVIKQSHIILLVADARMPVLSMNKEVKARIEEAGRKMIMVFNKIDLISQAQLDSLRRNNPGAFFVSVAKNIGINKMRESLIAYGREDYSSYLNIGMVGYPNVGKSSLINALTKRSSAKVSSGAGTTKGIQWVNIENLRFLDSPGVIPSEDRGSKLGLIGAKNPEKMENPVIVAHQIIKGFLNGDKEKLEAYYKIKLSDDVEEIFEAVAKKRGFLSKGGIVNETKTAIKIIRDWQTGKLGIKKDN